MQQQIAQSRNEIDQARLLCQKAAWTIDQHGNKEARNLVAQIKAVAPQMACNVIDRAIQVHGAAGVSDDTPLARLYGWHRAMRLFDGPDEVHMRTIARAELGREKSRVRRGGDVVVAAGPERCRARGTFATSPKRPGIRPGPVLPVQRAEPARRRTAATAVRRLGITDVADLRSLREVERRGPGQVPDGVVVHLLPFPELAADRGCEAPHEQAFERMMTEKPGDEDVAVAAGAS